MSTVPALPPAADAASCASWLPPEELSRLCAEAYAMARRFCEPPREAFITDGLLWSDRATFADDLLFSFRLLLGEYALGVGAGVMPFHDPECLARLREEDA